MGHLLELPDPNLKIADELILYFCSILYTSFLKFWPAVSLGSSGGGHADAKERVNNVGILFVETHLRQLGQVVVGLHNRRRKGGRGEGHEHIINGRPSEQCTHGSGIDCGDGVVVVVVVALIVIVTVAVVMAMVLMVVVVTLVVVVLVVMALMVMILQVK